MEIKALKVLLQEKEKEEEEEEWGPGGRMRVATIAAVARAFSRGGGVARHTGGKGGTSGLTQEYVGNYAPRLDSSILGPGGGGVSETISNIPAATAVGPHHPELTANL